MWVNVIVVIVGGLTKSVSCLLIGGVTCREAHSFNWGRFLLGTGCLLLLFSTETYDSHPGVGGSLREVGWY